ncbi:F510_1955 family glycosylhydrolase [Streptomyces sp. NP160]|uniref:F510_1955 family glycosylhydrolase n=1 Tax=Streptomyces sp. NP160 TaxID=2586637 RepID=UPI0035A67ED1
MRSTSRLWVVGVSASLTLTACTASAPSQGEGQPEQASTATWGHVHGLGVDPADGVLYVAAHDGLYRSTSDGVEGPVGQRRQDTMGFTVTGPGTFLGSGHPDTAVDPDLPNPLGLVVSRDSGQSWEQTSLGGQVDFHVLRARGDTVYGWDSISGQLLASDDAGHSWQARSDVAARDLAIDPYDPATVVATTAEGLQRSADGGRTWSVVAPSPLPVVVEWTDGGDLYGVEGDGAVLHSTDAGSSWDRIGDIGGSPEAITSQSPVPAAPTAADAPSADEAPTATVLHVAVAREGEHPSIATSRDGGRTFSEQALPDA